jgi:predicted dehydrogenase
MNQPHQLTRRSFIEKSAAATLGGALLAGAPAILRGADDRKKLNVALVGCGGRGLGAAGQALNADSNTQMIALADAFSDRLETGLKNLNASQGSKIMVEEKHKFVGLDAIDKVCAMKEVDVVLLATPPAFRAEHLKKCVEAGKHTFCEKPCATDAPGVRRFLEASAKAKEKGLGLLSGFCYRFANGEREFFKRVHGGEIGEVRSVYGAYMGGSPWAPKERKAEWGDLEYTLRNWIYSTWLSGDHLVEQAIHTVDKMLWAFQDATPVRAWSVAGRQQRIEEEYGNVFDHFGVCYEFEGGRLGTIFCRQQQGTWSDNGDRIFGTKGTGRIVAFRTQQYETIEGKSWKFDGEKGDMYQNEHNEFFASLRAGKPLHMGDQLAHSTMVGIMGRMAGYTGQLVSWEEANEAQEDLRPTDALKWDMKLPKAPIAMPGRTKLV